MAETIYVVTRGEYSDYRICGVYTARALADEAARLFQGDIEEWEANAVPDHPVGRYPFHVRMDRHGNVADHNGVEQVPILEAMKRDCHWEPIYGIGDFVYFFMFATDEDHAIKIANERRVQLIASGEWTTDWQEYWQKWPHGYGGWDGEED